MREAVGHRALSSIALQCVVTDLGGGVYGLLNIALFERSQFFGGIARPNARKTVRLQFDHHRNAVGFVGRALLTDRGRLLKNAKLILDMVADFVRNHIHVGIESLRLIRRHGKSVRHLRFDE